jgi:hypothetical protein
MLKKPERICCIWVWAEPKPQDIAFCFSSPTFSATC